MRHAKSSWDEPAPTDYERPLNKRGKHDAPLMGDVLKKLNIKPDIIISSGAKRAITTAKLVAEKIDYPIKKIIEEKKIYDESERGILKIINKLDDKYSEALLVGHNPVFTGLINILADYNLPNLPTAALAGIVFEVDQWQAVAMHLGKVFCYEYPKKYQ